MDKTQTYGVFENCSSLTSIKIPNSVTFIGENTFKNCIGLIGIIVPSSVTHVGGVTFSGCTDLKTIYFEAASKTSDYSSYRLDGCSATVYWGNRWHYVDGVPTLK